MMLFPSREVIELFQAYQDAPGNGAWGSLHIVLDDGNLAKHHIMWCFRECQKHDDTMGMMLCGFMLALSLREKRSLYRMVNIRIDEHIREHLRYAADDKHQEHLQEHTRG